MTSEVAGIRASLNKYQRTADARTLDLRLSFSRIVLDGLRWKGWSQRKLADEVGVSDVHICNIVHANANVSLELAGKILHALGVHAQFREVSAP